MDSDFRIDIDEVNHAIDSGEIIGVRNGAPTRRREKHVRVNRIHPACQSSGARPKPHHPNLFDGFRRLVRAARQRLEPRQAPGVEPARRQPAGHPWRTQPGVGIDGNVLARRVGQPRHPVERGLPFGRLVNPLECQAIESERRRPCLGRAANRDGRRQGQIDSRFESAATHLAIHAR